MKRVLATILGAFLVFGLTSVPAAQAAPKECIYMVKHVKKSGESYPKYTYEFMIWRKKGTAITGIEGGYPSEYADLKLKIKGKKATGTEWLYPDDMAVKVSYRLVGTGKTLRAKGYKRVSRTYMKQISDGYFTGMRGSC